MAQIVWGGGTERDSDAARSLRAAARCDFVALLVCIAPHWILWNDIRTDSGDTLFDRIFLFPACVVHVILLAVAVGKMAKHFSAAPREERIRALVWTGAAVLALISYPNHR